VEVVLLSVELVPFLLAFFLCTFLVLVEVAEVSVDVFCAFLAAGAAIRNGTATAVRRVLVTNFFMVYLSPLICGGFYFEPDLQATAFFSF
jgi:hypothetical protein